MRFSYAEAMTQATFYAPLAQAAEAAGYTSMTVADSVIYPQGLRLQVPLQRHGGPGVPRRQGVHRDDGPVRAPVRGDDDPPAHAVRGQAADPAAGAGRQAGLVLAYLSNNRLGLGVGISPWPEDFDAMGVDWAKRGKRMDECMDILRGLTSGEFFEYHGDFYDVDALKQCPGATETIPLLVGGHTDAALRRASLKGDGWMHAGGDGEELDRLLSGSPRSAPRRATPATTSRCT